MDKTCSNYAEDEKCIKFLLCKTEMDRPFGRPRRILENNIKMHPQSCILNVRTRFSWLRIRWHLTLKRQPVFNCKSAMKALNDPLFDHKVFFNFNSGTQWIYLSNGKSQSSIREVVLRHPAKCCVPVVKAIQLITWHKSAAALYLSLYLFRAVDGILFW
jgi:hypothetical protein